jgi:hypothetical protein
LQDLRGAKDTVDAVLVQVGFTPVHELQQDLQVVCPRPVQDDKQLVVRGCIDGRMAEQTFEVCTARRQDQSVSLEGLAYKYIVYDQQTISAGKTVI